MQLEEAIHALGVQPHNVSSILFRVLLHLAPPAAARFAFL